MNPLLQSVQIALQNATQKEAIAFIDKVVDFCIEHENGRVLEGWPEDRMQLLIAYHMAKHTFLFEQDEEGNIQGVFMWYNCNEDDGWPFVQNWEADDPEGNAIFMAFLFAESTDTFKRITQNFIIKCPEVMQKKLLGVRYRNQKPTKVQYTPKLFNRILSI
jgi:hypothetical protein